MLDQQFIRDVPLPKELTPQAIFDALNNTQDFFAMIREKAGVNLSSVIQANNFSGIVSNVFAYQLDKVSPYKLFHDQSYPDLKHEKHGVGLEIKATKKMMKGGEGHNGHSGWHIVVCFGVQENGDIEFVQVEVADLIGFESKTHSDWKYMGSKRNDNNSQRTETYVTTSIGTAKLRDGTFYLNTEKYQISRQLLRQRQKLAELPIPSYSPFSDGE